MYKFNFNVEEFLNHPVYTSAFIADLALLLFLPLIRPPIILSVLLVGILVYLSMFFGAKFGETGQQS
jgi:hypothetical protein